MKKFVNALFFLGALMVLSVQGQSKESRTIFLPGGTKTPKLITISQLEDYRKNKNYWVNAKLQYQEKDGFGAYIYITDKNTKDVIQTWFHVHLDKNGNIDKGGNGAHFKKGPGKMDNQDLGVPYEEATKLYHELRDMNLPSEGNGKSLSR